MTVVADPADPVGLHRNSLFVLVGAFEAVEVINYAGWVAGDGERFIVFNRPVGLDIDDDIFFSAALRQLK